MCRRRIPRHRRLGRVSSSKGEHAWVNPALLTWGKIKATLTSIGALFVLDLVAVVLPFYLLQREEARQPSTAILTGKISVPGVKDIRLILVEKPDYDQTENDKFTWRVPLIPNKEYSVLM